MAAVQGSTPDASAAKAALEGADIPGDVRRCLDEVSLPAYALDRFGIIRWLNPAALDLVGDVRGRQQTSVVAPEQAREARESFTRKVLGTERATDASVVLLDPNGQRVQAEISSVPLRDGGRIVGVFGVVAHLEPTAPPHPHPHLTPRQNQVLHMLARGRSTAQIANELQLSVETVRNHVRLMMRALGAHSRIEALAVAHREGILRPEPRGD
jgi:PAS domain S-box-containing protein